MSHLRETINDFVRGDSYQLPRTVTITDILPNTLAKAWLTVKRSIADSDEQAVFQKVITPTESDDGHIDEVGSESAAGHMYFLLTAGDTSAMAALMLYHYDIKVLSSAGDARVVESGRITASAAVTQASS